MEVHKTALGMHPRTGIMVIGHFQVCVQHVHRYGRNVHGLRALSGSVSGVVPRSGVFGRSVRGLDGQLACPGACPGVVRGNVFFFLRIFIYPCSNFGFRQFTNSIQRHTTFV